MNQNDLIRQFLALPAGSLPSATWADNDVKEEIGSLWPYLHDALRPEAAKRLNSFGFDAVLFARRPEWEYGVHVTL